MRLDSSLFENWGEAMYDMKIGHVGQEQEDELE